MRTIKLKIKFCVILILIVINLTGCAVFDDIDNKPIDYSTAENWAYFGIGEEKNTDVFLICPTVYTKDE